MLLRIYAANAARNEREAICEPYARMRERALARKSDRRSGSKQVFLKAGAPARGAQA